MSELPAIVSGLVIRPGDTLLLGMTDPMDEQTIDNIRKQFNEGMPGLKVAVIDHVTTLAVYRPELEGVARTVQCPNDACEHGGKPVEIRVRQWENAVEAVAPTCECGWAMFRLPEDTDE